MLEFNVINQRLIRIDKFLPASDSENYLKAKFNFITSDWSGKGITAYFRIGDTSYSKLIGGDSTCIVPSEVLIASEDIRLKRLGKGETFYISLCGVSGTTEITTNEIAVTPDRSGKTDTETPAEPTESMYQQILSAYGGVIGDLSNIANAIKGNLSGNVIYADDVSPIEHYPTVKISGVSNLESVKVLRCGKNLLTGFTTATKNGITYTVNADGSVAVSGTATAETTISARVNLYPGTYTISGELPNSSNGKGDIYVWSSANSSVVARAFTNSTARKFTLTANANVDVYLRIAKGQVCKGESFYPLLEIGNNATDYEVYICEIYTPDASGNIEGLTTISPNMTIYTDTNGAIVECEYIKDTNKVINKLINAITALGGSV